MTEQTKRHKLNAIFLVLSIIFFLWGIWVCLSSTTFLNLMFMLILSVFMVSRIGAFVKGGS